MKKIFLSLLIFFIATVCEASLVSKVVFFKNTSFPLICYFIKGESPGPTIMVQGGIQGDEICGVITAETLIQCRVKKGNLIVVPKANVPSILFHKRGINVDLNRRFDKDYKKFYEDHLARAIKLIVSFSDGLIHLHEGSGFYYPVFIDVLRNPKRYGQSFIIDTHEYKKKIKLEDTAKQALKELNGLIKNTHFKFNIFNTNTLSPTTKYPEQRKSFSFYTLTKLHKPAFAIEVSKDIKDLKWKSRIQLKATQILLKKLGVEVELPKKIHHPLFNNEFKEIRVFLDGEDITDKKVIKISEFSKFTVKERSKDSKRLFNPEIGLISADMPHLNLLKVNYLPLTKLRSLYLSYYGKKIKSWRVITENPQKIINSQKKDIFICQLNNEIIFVPDKSIVSAHEGDKLILLGVLNDPKEEIVNLKGYITRAGINEGQDLYSEIILNRDFFLPNYISFPFPKHKIWCCEVVRENGSKKDSSFKVVVCPRDKMFLHIKNKEKQAIISLDSNTKIELPNGTYEVNLYPISSNPNLLIVKDKLPLQCNRIVLNKGENIKMSFIDTCLAKVMGTLVLTGT